MNGRSQLGRSHAAIVASSFCLLASPFLYFLVGVLVRSPQAHDPLNAYAQDSRRRRCPPASLPDTLNWATPLVGMTLVAAIPLRGGMVNLGGDGQLVVGGLIGVLSCASALPVPGALPLRGRARWQRPRAGLYAALAAWGETRHRIPMLISSLLLELSGRRRHLLSSPAFPFATSRPVCRRRRWLPCGGAALSLERRLSTSVSLLIAAIAVLGTVFVDKRTVVGYEMRMRGNEPYASPATAAFDLYGQAIRRDVSSAARSPGWSAPSSCSARSSASSMGRS